MRRLSPLSSHLDLSGACVSYLLTHSLLSFIVTTEMVVGYDDILLSLSIVLLHFWKMKVNTTPSRHPLLSRNVDILLLISILFLHPPSCIPTTTPLLALVFNISASVQLLI
jgi:hypothetical protein